MYLSFCQITVPEPLSAGLIIMFLSFFSSRSDLRSLDVMLLRVRLGLLFLSCFWMDCMASLSSSFRLLFGGDHFVIFDLPISSDRDFLDLLDGRFLKCHLVFNFLINCSISSFH